MRIRFSSPANLGALEEAGVAAGRLAREAAEVYGAHTVEITLSANFESRTSTLGRAAQGALRRILDFGDVSQLEVKILDDDGIEDVDLIDEKMKFEEVLELPERDPDAHYRVRSAWLAQCFDEAREDIERLAH